MKVDIEDEALCELITTGGTKDRKYRFLKSNATFQRDLLNVLRIFDTVDRTDDLRKFDSLHYERLKHDLLGFSSVRIGYKSKYRLIFTEHEDGLRIILIEINEHYGDK